MERIRFAAGFAPVRGRGVSGEPLSLHSAQMRDLRPAAGSLLSEYSNLHPMIPSVEVKLANITIICLNCIDKQ